MTVRHVVGALAMNALAYLAIAFIDADLEWARGMLSWSRGDRGVFVYGVLCATFIGALLGSAMGSRDT
jgi:hypothetical protein